MVVGATVGIAVGCVVGNVVGCAEAVTVGCSECAKVGSLVLGCDEGGGIVGDKVSPLVEGLSVMVGTDDGEGDGRGESDGNREGPPDGIEDGKKSFPIVFCLSSFSFESKFLF